MGPKLWELKEAGKMKKIEGLDLYWGGYGKGRELTTKWAERITDAVNELNDKARIAAHERARLEGCIEKLESWVDDAAKTMETIINGTPIAIDENKKRIEALEECEIPPDQRNQLAEDVRAIGPVFKRIDRLTAAWQKHNIGQDGRIEALERKAPPANAPLPDEVEKPAASETPEQIEIEYCHYCPLCRRQVDALYHSAADGRDCCKLCGSPVQWRPFLKAGLITIPVADARVLVDWLISSMEELVYQARQQGQGVDGTVQWSNIERIRDDLKWKCGEKS